jgi:hypothetical protein
MSNDSTRWRGLRIVDDRLWVWGPTPRLLHRYRFRFEPEGLIVVRKGCDVANLPWPQFVAECTVRSVTGAWSVFGWPGTGNSPPRFDVFVNRAVGIERRLVRHGVSSWRLCVPVPVALVKWIAATPSTHESLAEPARLRQLIADLMQFRPYPGTLNVILPGERATLVDVVYATLGRHAPIVDRRLVATVDVPSVAVLVAEAMSDLPRMVRPDLVPDVEAKLTKLMENAVGARRWPFAALLPVSQ